MPTELERELAVERLRREIGVNLAGAAPSELGAEALETLSGWLRHYGFSIVDENLEIVEL